MLKHPVISFSIRLVLMLSLAFTLHLVLLQIAGLPLFENKVVASYMINTLLTISIFFGLYRLKEKYSSQIGFLFLGSSFLKFAVFFIVFYGAYKANGNIDTLEFLAFFTPYSLCLVLETIYLSKWLNEM
jgi:hypothetical protein|tara:strand:+ start:237 stop:623 length:387 start_codon:yes stop_codon:yes gene_type:complete